MALFEKKAWFWKKVVVYIDRCFFLVPSWTFFFLLLVSGERCHLKEITKYFPSFVYHCPSPPFVHAFSRAFFQWTPPGCPHCAALVVGAPEAKWTSIAREAATERRQPKPSGCHWWSAGLGKCVERRVVTGFAKITVVGSCEICGLKMSGFVLRPFLLNTMIVGKRACSCRSHVSRF